jgi:hypothetical protein
VKSLIKKVLTLLLIVCGITFVKTLDTWLFPYPYTYTEFEPPHTFEDFRDITALEITYNYKNTDTVYRFYKIVKIDEILQIFMNQTINIHMTIYMH